MATDQNVRATTHERRAFLTTASEAGVLSARDVALLLDGAASVSRVDLGNGLESIGVPEVWEGTPKRRMRKALRALAAWDGSLAVRQAGAPGWVAANDTSVIAWWLDVLMPLGAF